MKPPQWPRRAARAVREFVLCTATRGRGVRLMLNGLPVRVDAATRHRFSTDYERQVAAFLRHRIQPGSEVWNVGANVGAYVLQAGAWVGAVLAVAVGVEGLLPPPPQAVDAIWITASAAAVVLMGFPPRVGVA